MLVLVQNDDGAKQSRQVNLEGFDTFMLRFIVNNSKDTKTDVLFREKYQEEAESGFLTIPIDLVKRYKEPSKVEALEEIR